MWCLSREEKFVSAVSALEVTLKCESLYAILLEEISLKRKALSCLYILTFLTRWKEESTPFIHHSDFCLSCVLKCSSTTSVTWKDTFPKFNDDLRRNSVILLFVNVIVKWELNSSDCHEHICHVNKQLQATPLFWWFAFSAIMFSCRTIHL